MKIKKNVLKGVGALSAFVLITSLTVGTVLEQNASMVDDALHTQSSVVVTDPDANLYTFGVGEKYNTTDKVFKEMKDLAVRMQTEGTVLLKNQDTCLPLKTGAKITLLGAYSHKPAYGGNMHGPKASQVCVSLEEALKDAGYALNPTMIDAYQAFFDADKNNTPNKLPTNMWMTYSLEKYRYRSNEQTIDTVAGSNRTAVYDSFKEYDDVGLVVFGRPTAEAGDYFTGAKGTVKEEGGSDNSLGLTANERSLLTTAKANFKKVIVLINADNPMEIGELKDDPDIDAVIWGGMYGQYGAIGVANVIKGEYKDGKNATPSGGLPDIYVYDSSSHPCDANFGVTLYSNYADIEKASQDRWGEKWCAAYQVQTEGIYNGYRYFETRYYDSVMGDAAAKSTAGAVHSAAGWNYSEEVVYPFGYGLSYTTFDYKLDSVELLENGKKAVAKGSVTNTGKVAGKTPIQIYVQAPYTKGGIEKSAIQLAQFGKTTELKAGEKYDYEIGIDMSYVASYDEKNTKSYYMDAGDYYFAVGNGSHEALNNILALQGKTPANTSGVMDDEGNAAAAKVVANAYKGHETIFNTSKAGTKVTNLFDDYNPNNLDFDKKVTFLSRSDWQGTYPTTVEGLTAGKKVIDALVENGYYEIHENGDPDKITFCKEWKKGISYVDMKGASYDDPRWEDFLSEMKLSEVLNTVLRGNGQIYGMPTINSFDSYAIGDSLGFNNAMGAKADPNDPCWGGKNPKEDPHANDFARCIPTETVIGATFNKDLAVEQGIIYGVTSIYTNTTVLWGPCITPHRGTGYGRISENYSEDPVLNGLMACETAKIAWEQYGCIVAYKHFALNNQEINRIGLAVFGNEQGLREIELRSFQIGFENGGTGLMNAFNRIGTTWAGANRALLIDLLRKEWGFRGYVLTDIVVPGWSTYQSGSGGIMGGSNIYDNTSDAYYKDKNGTWGYFAESQLETVKKDKIFMDQLKENTHELMYMVVNSNAMNGIGKNTKNVWQLTWWRGIYISIASIAGISIAASVALYVIVSIKRSKKGEK